LRRADIGWPWQPSTVAQMALTLLYWQQLVRYLDRHG
jgi:hypothetical protein